MSVDTFILLIVLSVLPLDDGGMVAPVGIEPTITP